MQKNDQTSNKISINKLYGCTSILARQKQRCKASEPSVKLRFFFGVKICEALSG